jgi:hypothetical protein
MLPLGPCSFSTVHHPQAALVLMFTNFFPFHQMIFLFSTMTFLKEFALMLLKTSMDTDMDTSTEIMAQNRSRTIVYSNNETII